MSLVLVLAATVSHAQHGGGGRESSPDDAMRRHEVAGPHSLHFRQTASAAAAADSPLLLLLLLLRSSSSGSGSGGGGGGGSHLRFLGADGWWRGCRFTTSHVAEAHLAPNKTSP